MGTARAVDSLRVVAGSFELADAFLVGVDVPRRAAMAAGDDNSTWTEVEQGSRELEIVCELFEAPAGGRQEGARLRKVRGQDRRERYELTDQGHDSVRVEQLAAGARGEHRVEHDRYTGQARTECRSDRLDRCRRCQHADLDRINPDVVDHCLDLRAHDRGRNDVNRTDPARVLRGHGRDRDRAVHAAARERLEVGLDAGAAAGVGTGDRESPR